MMTEPLENQPTEQKSNFDGQNKNPSGYNQNKSTDKEGERQIDENEIVDSSPASPALAQLEALIKGPLSK